MQISVNDNTTAAELTDEMMNNKEIDDTLDEFSRMLSHYSCDGDATDPAPPSIAQTRLESLFVPPDRNDNSTTSAAAGNASSPADSDASER